nr:hypothetical protein Iba_chr06cCG11210 [Ipomoea batatas]
MEAAVTTADWLRKSSAVPTANVACGCGAYCSTANILLWKEWRMLSGTCKWETKEIAKWSSGVVESVNLIGIRKSDIGDNLPAYNGGGRDLKPMGIATDPPIQGPGWIQIALRERALTFSN